jgi:cardiolipin synthase
MWFQTIVGWLFDYNILLFFDILCIVSVIFIERKKPSEAVAWVLAITFLPVFGFILYLLIGETASLRMSLKFGRKMRSDSAWQKMLNEKMRKFNAQPPSAAGSQYACGNPCVRDNLDMIRMNERQDFGYLSMDNAVDVYTKAEDKYRALYDDIANAKKSVHMLYFQFSADSVGRRFIDLLARKAREGVEVRVLYDTIGNILTRYLSFGKIVAAGGKVHRFFPLVNIFKVNYRNHRKIAVIDGKIAYTGGININKAYIGQHRRAKPWRDTHIRLTGSGVCAFQECFLQDWIYVSGEKFDFGDESLFNEYFPPPDESDKGDVGMQAVSSGPDIDGQYIKYGYVKMINSAKESLYMQSPYFIPDDAFMLALKLAVNSGVDVRVILPGIPDKPKVYVLTRSYMEELLQAGVRVYLYNGFIHSKMFIMDGKVTSIGTTNIDIRSFRLDFEINAFLYSERFSQKCVEIFFDDIKNSSETSLERLKRRNPLLKLLEAVLRIFSPLL